MEGQDPRPLDMDETEYRTYAIYEGLTVMRSMHREGASNLPGKMALDDPNDLREGALGAFVELGELVNATQWKSWRKYKPLTEAEKEHLLEEWADVQVFLARLSRNLTALYGITPLDLAQAYVQVSERNKARFRGEVPGREPPDPDIEAVLMVTPPEFGGTSGNQWDSFEVQAKAMEHMNQSCSGPRPGAACSVHGVVH